MKQDGYRVYLFFPWLPSDELALALVANRVRQGGHNIQEADIRRRFKSGITNFFDLYCTLCDSKWLDEGSRFHRL